MNKIISLLSLIILTSGCGGSGGGSSGGTNISNSENSIFNEDYILTPSGWEASLEFSGIMIETQRSNGGWTAEIK